MALKQLKRFKTDEVRNSEEITTKNTLVHRPLHHIWFYWILSVSTWITPVFGYGLIMQKNVEKFLHIFKFHLDKRLQKRRCTSTNILINLISESWGSHVAYLKASLLQLAVNFPFFTYPNSILKMNYLCLSVKSI